MKSYACLCLLLAGVFCVACFSGACADELPPTLKPQVNPRAVYDWKKRHEAVMERNRTVKPEYVVFGDSITHRWGGEPSGDNRALGTGKTAWDCAQDTVVRSILPGGMHHEGFIAYLDKVADFFSDLKDSKGELIPVIFRMYHEHTGGWFWWGNKQCTPEEYNELYRMTVRHLRDKRGIHNILYGFSPAGISTEAEFLSRYPGDEWIDIIGFDTYFYAPEKEGSAQKYTQDIRAGLEVVTNYAKKTDKIPVLAETGLEGVVIDNYFSEILYPATLQSDTA